MRWKAFLAAVAMAAGMVVVGSAGPAQAAVGAGCGAVVAVAAQTPLGHDNDATFLACSGVGEIRWGGARAGDPELRIRIYVNNNLRYDCRWIQDEPFACSQDPPAASQGSNVRVRVTISSTPLLSQAAVLHFTQRPGV